MTASAGARMARTLLLGGTTAILRSWARVHHTDAIFAVPPSARGSARSDRKAMMDLPDPQIPRGAARVDGPRPSPSPRS